MPLRAPWYAYAFNTNWALRARVDWYSAIIDKYDGRIINSGLSVNYSMTQHFGVGVGYNFFSLDIGVDDDSWQTASTCRLNGPYFYFSA